MFWIKGEIKNTVEKSNVLNIKKIKQIPNARPQSPIRFITIALKADLFAKIRCDQKLINKYEDNPTPSQPKNNWIKLPEVNKITIKKVNKDKYDRNFINHGSSNIYSVE